MSLEGMTQEKWNKMTVAQKEAARDMSGLTPQLIGKEGWRVEVETLDGQKRRFNVGRSTGWKPCHLEVHNRRSLGGSPAEKEYKSVKTIRAVPY